FTLDMSTSAAAMGKIRLAYISGASVEEHLLQDAQGHPATDPAVLFMEPKGSLLPMGGSGGGYKGFGLSMMVDCLVAGLSGGFAPPAPEGAPPTNNVLVNIWNPEKFSGVAHMQKEAEKYLAFVRATPPVDPARPVRVAGDRAQEEKIRREKNGIPLSRGSAVALARQAEKLGIAAPAAFNG
ncbi:MAG: Ldh family oxidoreductase, partial [Alphaproteobacteria bacterium]|nr:Ldh family oxidoreductase [Alphaproteobacteria bacterium]